MTNEFGFTIQNCLDFQYQRTFSVVFVQRQANALAHTLSRIPNFMVHLYIGMSLLPLLKSA